MVRNRHHSSMVFGPLSSRSLSSMSLAVPLTTSFTRPSASGPESPIMSVPPAISTRLPA
ncbi:hypothetical protein K435DRAFT_474256 [Dendrothele bispora CBS 962.96]|uniref:Uncharacterized protein n=1 Tax=Dendrothele bispora (strain CBS 962.96) TaxID=1314807 RepID=A0A4S8KZS2_DENBC|nr:hypothetical protein K435DRAFT_474256 [Dendrothele bispora CBS 962.96]